MEFMELVMRRTAFMDNSFKFGFLKPTVADCSVFLKTAWLLCPTVNSMPKFCTIPLDTAKVRLQLQKRVPLGDSEVAPKYKGLLGTVATIAKEEGLFSLWKGIVPGLHRQCVYGGLRMGCAIAIAVANPTDLVKVRLQAEGKLPVGAPRRYGGALHAYYAIVSQEGVAALWTGLGPNIARNAIVNAAELASYDHVKETILKIPGFTDNVLTHVLAGLGAGFFAVCIGSPVDVVKSRMMGDSVYKSTIDCFFKTLKTEFYNSVGMYEVLYVDMPQSSIIASCL
ncbi:UNVERIFIED_CONTAM: Mitochondrial uncoupling protein 2 [Sesamum calycinum]|uniref:Mitochondrial uncoupling protein 2 n=1 Tax=Sesamum calycinum TaxID=2727403 RepID=A0AAW2J0H4_9LAMI